jgi:hypothetical protein
MDSGQVARDGAPTVVVAEYLAASVPADADGSTGAFWSAGEGASTDDAPGDTTELSLLAAGIRNGSGEQTAAVRFDQPFRVEVSYRVNDSIQDAAVLVSFMDLAGNLIFESWDTDSGPNGYAQRSPGTYQSSCIIPKALLKPGRYWLNLAAHVPNRKVFDRIDHVLAFDVLPVEGSFNSDRLGLLSPVLDWEIRKLS